MRAESAWVTAVGVGRIQDKTRWTKALGEAVTFVYGDLGGMSSSKYSCWPETVDLPPCVDAVASCDKISTEKSTWPVPKALIRWA